MALNAALATASRALELFSTGVQVSANNIANANSPGFIREELQIDAANPFQRGALIVGSGAQATSVKQIIDQYLEKRIHTAGSNASASQARQEIYSQLEAQLRELGDTDLSTRLSEFTAAINEVVNQPELLRCASALKRSVCSFSRSPTCGHASTTFTCSGNPD